MTRTFCLAVKYKRRNKSLKQKPRVDVFPNVKAPNEKEARLALLTNYVQKGFRVIQIWRDP